MSNTDKLSSEELKRYDLETKPYHEGATMKQSKDGDWVSIEDYQHLEKRLEEERKINSDAITNLRSELELCKAHHIKKDQQIEFYQELNKWSNKYEFSFQIWGAGRYTIFIEKDGIHLTEFGGRDSFEEAITDALEWIYAKNRTPMKDRKLLKQMDK